MTTPETHDLLVRSLTWEADGVLSVELVHPAGAALPPVQAGAHLDLHLPTQPAPLVRSYSLCNSPGDSQRYVLGVGRDRASRGGSRWVHEHLRPGQRLAVVGPRNHFQLNESAPSFALLAGGIGVTPILAMARRLAVLGKPVELLYAVRDAGATAFLAELKALVPGLALHMDSQAGGPPDIVAFLARQPRDTGCYCCGPAPMLDAFEATCARLGLADAHVERFSAPVTSGEATGACTVVLQRSGKRVPVAAGKSILDALLDAGVDVAYSCSEGVCGTCEQKVLAGEIDHRDGVLSPAERAAGNVMMICVSGCKSAQLVLDL